MTKNDRRFDDLTKLLGRTATRRTIFKSVIASAIGGVFARFVHQDDDVAEAARFRPACARVGQACSTGPDAINCCSGLTCNSTTHTCCIPNNESCSVDADCCGGTVCRPNPNGLGGRCLPPGDVGQRCLTASDCVAGLDCVGGVCCGNVGHSCATKSDCCGALFCLDTGNGLTCVVNAPPVAGDQTLSTPEDTALGVTLTGTDPNGDTLTFSVVSGPSHGALSGSVPNLTYTPNLNYNGPDAFVFKVDDGHGASDNGTISISVTAVNDAPTASDKSVVTTEDTPTSITLTATDVDGDPLTYIVTTPPANGSLSGTAPNLTYTPTANYNGTDSFQFKVNDGTVDSNIATVSITINAVNDPPVANAQTLSTAEDTPLSITLTASDVEGDTLTYTVTSNPAHGTLSGTAPMLTYTPDANYNGPDSFQFKANDSQADSNIATISIDVTPVNDPPVASDQTVVINEDTPTPITLTATDVDGDTLTFTVTTPPVNGSLTGTPPDVTYTPTANYHGTDSFVFTVDDGQGGTDTGTISITINAVNDPPVANDQTLSTAEDTPLTITLTASDVDLDTLTFSVVAPGPAHGALTGTVPNLTYTPAANYNGPDTFDFSVDDGNGGTDTGTISITVTTVNDPPVADDQTVNALAGTPLPITLTASDVDGDPLTYTVTTPPTSGSLTGTPPDVSYTSTLAVSGTDSFVFTVDDGNGGTDTGTITINVVAQPDAVDDAYGTPTNTVLNVPADGVLGNDTANGATPTPLTAAATTQGGTVTLLADGSFSYTPPTDFGGLDTFDYTLTNLAGTDSATVTITVGSAPSAVNDAYDAAQATQLVVPAPGVFANDDRQFATFVSPPTASTQGGVVALAADGSFTYDPPSGFTGVDTFQYTISNGIGAPSTATVTITVVAPPVANDDSYNATLNTQLSVAAGTGLLFNDTQNGATLTAPATTTQGGTLAVAADGSFTYDQPSGFTGADTFMYSLANFAGSDSATVTINVYAPPVANDDSYQVIFNGALVTTAANGLFANDTGTSISVTANTSPAHGTLSAIAADGSFTYTPTTGYSGPDSFTYTIGNPVGTDTATVTLDVVPPPVAVDDSGPAYITPEDTALNIAAPGVLANDTVNSATLTTLSNAPTTKGGTVTLLADGSFTYTPPAGFFSATNTDFDTFDYTLTNVSGSDTATVKILVGTAPTATNDSFNATGNVQLTTANITAPPGAPTSVLANDTLHHATITAVGATSNGGVVNLDTSTGTFTYTSAPGFTGTETFTYTLTNAIGTSTGTVSVVVTNTIWFIDNSVTTSGNGTLASPFKTIADYTASSPTKDANDIIFFFTGNSATTPYAGALTLLSGQKVIGQGVALSSEVSFASGSAASPPAGTRAKFANAAATAITLNTNNTVRGVTLGDLTSLSGTAVGALTVNSADKNGTGAALKVATSGTLAVTFDGMTSSTSSPETVINLTGVGGTFTVTSTTTITNPTGSGIAINSALASFVADFQNTTTISGSSAAGLSLQGNNAGASTKFTTLNIAPASSARGIDGSNAGKLTVTGGTISTTNARGVSINTAALTMTLATLNVAGGGVADNGLVLASTTGTFALNGTGTTDGSGGTIQATTNDGVVLTSAAGVTLKNLNVTNCNGDGIEMSSITGALFDNLNVSGSKNNGIFGNTITNWTLQNSSLGNNGKTTHDIVAGRGYTAGVYMQDLFGTCTVKDSDIFTSWEMNMVVENNAATTLNLTATNMTFRDLDDPTHLSGANGVLVLGDTSAQMTTTFNTCTFSHNRSRGIHADAAGSARVTVDITNCPFTANFTDIDISASETAQMLFNVNGNTIDESSNTAVAVIVNAVTSDLPTQTPTVGGKMDSNTITGRGALVTGGGMRLAMMSNGNSTLQVNSNALNSIGVGHGIEFNVDGPSSNNSFTALNNVVHVLGASPHNGIKVPTDNSVYVCLHISGNTSTVAGGGYGIRVDKLDTPGTNTATFAIEGLNVDGTNETLVANFLSSTNNSSTARATLASGAYTNATCTTP